MDGATWSSGMSTAWAEVRTWLTGVSFARPYLLWLLVGTAVLFLILRVVQRREDRRLLGFGKLSLLRIRFGRTRWWKKLVFSLGLTVFIFGLAGPQWGIRPISTVGRGRDVVLVFDISRSMRARDMESTKSRFESAIQGAREWMDAVRARSGNRVAVVVFASRPVLWVPLTADLNLVQAKLQDLDVDVPPNATRPVDDQSRSGTRIGAGLALAVEQHDPAFGGAQDIILFTDADDPEDDREWNLGINRARTANIPLHVVGVGDPTQSTPLLLSDINDELISTKLFEDVAQTIAREGRGGYLSARRKPVELTVFFREVIGPLGQRELIDKSLSEKNDRSPWFYAAAVVLLVLGWCCQTLRSA
jgi:Ca-activated chloride channel family protein